MKFLLLTAVFIAGVLVGGFGMYVWEIIVHFLSRGFHD